MESLIVYFDYKSPYAFLATQPARGLAAAFGLRIDWRPYTLEIPDFLGAVESRNEHQWRRVRYSYLDARRLANDRGLTVLGPQRMFNSRIAHIGALYAQREGMFDGYHDRVFERFFRRQLDIEDAAAVAGVLAEAGAKQAEAAGPPGFAAFLDSEGEALYRQTLREAEAMGVFGVPTFVVGTEVIWGSDRLDMVRRTLAAALRSR